MRLQSPGIILAACLLAALPARAEGDAPGAPGAPSTWTNGNKQGVGTSATLESKVWFTLGDGTLTEVYWPRLDTAQTRRLEFLVSSGDGLLESESENAHARVEVPDAHALVFRQVNTGRSGRWRLTKTFFTDPSRQALVVRVRFERLHGGPLRLFAHFDPALGNSGRGDSAYALEGALLSEEKDAAAALLASTGFAQTNSGYAGASDGLRELRAGLQPPRHARAADGNVAQLAELALAPVTARVHELTLALGFGSDARGALDEARAALRAPWRASLREYAAGWRAWLRGLRRVKGRHAALFSMAAMQLKAHEDKTHRGAMIASLTKPWGDESNADANNVGGYHLVWSRDLYHVATAFIALGDRAAAGRALDYLFRVQQRPDGSFPQNTWLDGRPYWTSLQMDEVAYPLLLAHALGRDDAETFARHVRPAAEYIVARGPGTPQERWEEEEGYSPSTIAAEIAGLLVAAEIAERHDARFARRWRGVARGWARTLDAWTVTRTGPHSKEPYFVRLTRLGRPDWGEKLELNNGAGTFDEREIVDAGFLELVRLGIRRPDDPVVVRSLEIVDRLLRRETPRGPAFYRYNHDGYGEKADGRGYDGTGIGRLWVLLSGERGEYERLAGRDARPWLQAMASFANEGRLLSEQVWDRAESPRPHLRFGQGTGSATPLAWSCAQFVRLALSIQDRRAVGQPEVVRRFFERDAGVAEAAGPED